MVGAIVGLGVSAASSIIGGISARKAAKKQARMLEEERSKNQAWYDRRYNEDSTQRADAQAALTRMREAMQERSQRAAGTASVMGLSESSVATEKEAQNQAMAETISTIAAQGDKSKDAIEAQYMERDANLTAQKQAMEANKAASIAESTGNAFNVAGSIAGAFDAKDDFLKKSEGLKVKKEV